MCRINVFSCYNNQCGVTCTQLLVRHTHTWWHHLPPLASARRVPDRGHNDALPTSIHATLVRERADANLEQRFGGLAPGTDVRKSDVIRHTSADLKKTSRNSWLHLPRGKPESNKTRDSHRAITSWNATHLSTQIPETRVKILKQGYTIYELLLA